MQKLFEIKNKNLLNNLLTGLTPVEKKDNYWFKREDLFCVAGVFGGKARACYSLAIGEKVGLITAGSKQSPQINIVAQISKNLGLKCRAHTPCGELSAGLICAKQAGAEIIQHKMGYNNVIISRAILDSKILGWKYIPFGMECETAVNLTAHQVINIPEQINHIVVPVGSGITLCGILTGIVNLRRNITVTGVIVGADPCKRLNKYAPKGWGNMVTLVHSNLDYHTYSSIVNFQGIELDPIYESKCIPYLKQNDLLWIVGIR